jgi:hypothetical protein
MWAIACRSRRETMARGATGKPKATATAMRQGRLFGCTNGALITSSALTVAMLLVVSGSCRQLPLLTEAFYGEPIQPPLSSPNSRTSSPGVEALAHPGFADQTHCDRSIASTHHAFCPPGDPRGVAPECKPKSIHKRSVSSDLGRSGSTRRCAQWHGRSAPESRPRDKPKRTANWCQVPTFGQLDLVRVRSTLVYRSGHSGITRER